MFGSGSSGLGNGVNHVFFTAHRASGQKEGEAAKSAGQQTACLLMKFNGSMKIRLFFDNFGLVCAPTTNNFD